MIIENIATIIISFRILILIQFEKRFDILITRLYYKDFIIK